MPTGPLARPTVGSVLLLSDKLYERSMFYMAVNWEEVFICLSADRLLAYTEDKTDSPEAILQRYTENLENSQNLYIPLNILEVVLRNKIHQSIAEIFNENNWLQNTLERRATPLSKALNKLDLQTMTFLLKQIEESKKTSEHVANIQKRNVVEGDLVANLNFGFWTFILNKKYSNIFHDKGLFEKTFSSYRFSAFLPHSDYYREEALIRAKVDKIRKIRNRVFHHERIKDYSNVKKEIWDLISYLSKEIRDLFYK